MPALHQMLEALYGVSSFISENPLVSQIDIAVTRFLPLNPQRLSFTFVNLSANVVYIAPNNAVASSFGIRLAPNGGNITIQWDRDFELCSKDWYATATANNSECYCLENIAE